MINFAHRGASRYYPENTILSLKEGIKGGACLLYTSPSPRDISGSRMPASA